MPKRVPNILRLLLPGFSESVERHSGGKPAKRSTLVDDLTDEWIAPALKTAGFSKDGRTWRRRSADGAVQVVNLQLHRYNILPKQKFTINVGLSVDAMWPIVKEREPPRNIKEYDCFFRARLGKINSNFTSQQDVWWTVRRERDVKKVGRELSDEISTSLLPFLRKYHSTDAILALIAEPPPDAMLMAAVVPCTAEWLLGNHESARSKLAAIIADDPTSGPATHAKWVLKRLEGK